MFGFFLVIFSVGNGPGLLPVIPVGLPEKVSGQCVNCGSITTVAQKSYCCAICWDGWVPKHSDWKSSCRCAASRKLEFMQRQMEHDHGFD